MSEIDGSLNPSQTNNEKTSLASVSFRFSVFFIEVAGCVCVRFASRLCCLFCSFPSTTTLCWKVERSVADWISCTLKRPSWIRSTTDERLDCPTPHTLTSWEHTHTPCSEQSGGDIGCDVHLTWWPSLLFSSLLAMKARREWWNMLDINQVIEWVYDLKTYITNNYQLV